MTLETIISIEGVSKVYTWEEKYKGFGKIVKGIIKPKYKIVNALDNVELKIQKGEIVGLLGPNGAGKSTLFKCMTGILKVDLGKVEVFGLEVWKNRRKITPNIGAFFGNKGLMWWNLPVIKSFELMKEIYRIPDKEYEERLEFYSELIGDKEYLEKPPRQLSYGQRQRTEIVTCLLHNPQIVFLDEPTLGMDVMAKEQLARMICECNRRNGTTFIISTHDLKDVEEMCSRIVIINKGKIVKNSDAESIKEDLKNNYVLEIDFKSDFNQEVLREMAIDFKVTSKRSIRIDIRSSCSSIYELMRRIDKKSPIATFRIEYQTIEDVIKAFY